MSRNVAIASADLSVILIAELSKKDLKKGGSPLNILFFCELMKHFHRKYQSGKVVPHEISLLAC